MACRPTRPRVAHTVPWVGLVMVLLGAKGGAPAVGQQPPRTEVVEEEVHPDPGWELRRLSGERFTLGSLRGRPVFVNMWASWCPPCVAELASIDGLARAVGDGVEVLLVSPEDQSSVRSFLGAQELEVEPVLEETLAPETLGLEALPHTVILGPDGRLVLRHRGAADWNTPEVERLLRSLIVEQQPEPRMSLVTPGDEREGWTLALEVPAGWRMYAPRGEVPALGLPLTARWATSSGSKEVALAGPEPTEVVTEVGRTEVHRGNIDFRVGPAPPAAQALEVTWALCRDDRCVPGRTRLDLPVR